MPLLFEEGYGMDAKTYVKISVVNLAFLLAGMGIRSAMETREVHAQTKQDVEEITPMISSPSAAFQTLLAGRIAADQVMVKGVDIVKLQENLINLLATKPFVASQAEFQAAIDKARVTPLRMKSPEPPQPTPQGGGKQ
jgi:hypothetical protein